MVNDDKHRILFGTRRSIRYHNHRCLFYKSINLTLNFMALMLVLVMLISSFTHYSGSVLLTIFTAFTFALNLMIQAPIKSLMHSVLAQRFISLEKLILNQPKPTNQDISDWVNERLMIEQFEPPVLHVLDVICHNELVQEMKYGETYIVKIGLLQRLFAHFFDYDLQSLKVDLIPY